jgi:hypothetical protein
MRRRVACFLGCYMCLAAAFIDDGIGHAHSNQAGGNALVSAQHHGFLHQRAGVVGKALGQSQYALPSPDDLAYSGLMIESTQEIGLGGSNRGKGGQFKVPQIKQKQCPGPGELHHRIHIFTIRDIPGNEREVIKRVTLVLPHQLNLRAGFAATAARPGKFLGQTRG